MKVERPAPNIELFGRFEAGLRPVEFREVELRGLSPCQSKSSIACPEAFGDLPPVSSPLLHFCFSAGRCGVIERVEDLLELK